MKSLLIMLFLFSPLVFSTEAELSVTTFNAGLAHTFVSYAKERLPHIANSLGKLDSDVICLQEVWTKKDRKKIRKILKNKYPYSISTKIKNVKSNRRPTCKVKELFGKGKFVACMQKNCSDLDGDEFTDCIINTCGTALRNLKNDNRECATSLMAQVGKSTLAGLFTILNPLKRAGLFAYKGSNGLMLFSKRPMEDMRVLSLKDLSTLNKREALVAKVKVGSKKVKVMCTHITADLESTVPYTGKFSSWRAENLAQVNLLLQEAKLDQSPLVLLGDFNCGESNPERGLDGELEANCRQLHHPDLTDALKEKGPVCTFCRDNLLNGPDANNSMIDHIYVRGGRALKTDVIFKKPIFIDVKKKKVKTNLSDHYGISSKLQF